MLEIGKLNRLPIQETSPRLTVLDGGAYGLIDWAGPLLTKGLKTGDEIEGFLYSDPEGYLYMCAKEVPYAHLEMIKVTVGKVDEDGALIDWKRPHHLFIPRSEQQFLLKEGEETTIVFVIDNQKMLCFGSTLYEKYFQSPLDKLQLGKEYSGIVLDQSPTGFRFLLDSNHIGFVYFNESEGEVEIGKRYNVYLKWVRPDGKIDLTMKPLGYDNRIDHAVDTIVEKMKKNNGYLFVNDDSTSVEINEATGLSKKLFKMALGKLLKDRKIVVHKDKIKLL